MFVIGRNYTRPCIKLPVTNGVNFWFAILHTHYGDISGEEHHHLDMRFIPDRILRLLESSPNSILACGTENKVEKKIRRCVREAATVELEALSTKQMAGIAVLQERNQNRRVDLSKLHCPHQGCRLEATTEVKGQSCYVCPCHGLAWAVESGTLVKR